MSLSRLIAMVGSVFLVVRPQAIARAFSGLGSERKQIVPLRLSQDPSQHVLAGNILSPGTTDVLADKIYYFVRHGM